MAAGAGAARCRSPFPDAVAKGEPGEGYPFPWSIRRWLDGETAAPANDRRPGGFARVGRGVHPRAAARRRHRRTARRCAQLLPGRAAGALRRRDPRGPRRARRADRHRPGRRGLGRRAARPLDRPPVWFHGDIAARQPAGRGRPAGRRHRLRHLRRRRPGLRPGDRLDVLLRRQPRAFRRRSTRTGTWARARGWALWKALLVLAGTSTPVATPIRNRCRAGRRQPSRDRRGPRRSRPLGLSGPSGPSGLCGLSPAPPRGTTKPTAPPRCPGRPRSAPSRRRGRPRRARTRRPRRRVSSDAVQRYCHWSYRRASGKKCSPTTRAMPGGMTSGRPAALDAAMTAKTATSSMVLTMPTPRAQFAGRSTVRGEGAASLRYPR